MKQRILLSQATIPHGDRVLKLYQGKDDCSIVIFGRGELMSTRKHASEHALGTLPCELLKQVETASVLIGGLGMGYTLAWIIHEITKFFRAPFPRSKSCSGCAPRSKYSLYSTPSQNSLREKGSVKEFGVS